MKIKRTLTTILVLLILALSTLGVYALDDEDAGPMSSIIYFQK